MQKRIISKIHRGVFLGASMLSVAPAGAQEPTVLEGGVEAVELSHGEGAAMLHGGVESTGQEEVVLKARTPELDLYRLKASDVVINYANGVSAQNAQCSVKTFKKASRIVDGEKFEYETHDGWISPPPPCLGRVVSGSGAEAGGLKVGDHIVGIIQNGKYYDYKQFNNVSAYSAQQNEALKIANKGLFGPIDLVIERVVPEVLPEGAPPRQSLAWTDYKKKQMRVRIQWDFSKDQPGAFLGPGGFSAALNPKDFLDEEGGYDRYVKWKADLTTKQKKPFSTDSQYAPR